MPNQKNLMPNFKARQAKRKRLSRNKRKLENPKSLSHLEIEAQIKKKKNWNERDMYPSMMKT